MPSGIRLPRRRLLALALAAGVSPALAAPPAPTQTLSTADEALVERGRDYLRGLASAMGRFTQIDPRGRITTGTFYLHRPGRARFEYDPPSGLVVASNSFRVAVLDKRLGTLNAYPLAATPLGVLLSRDIRIDKSVEIGGVSRRPGGFAIAARQASRRSQGEISLDFTDGPLALAGWSITDPRGGVTRVALTHFAATKPLPDAFFELAPPGATAKTPET